MRALATVIVLLAACQASGEPAPTAPTAAPAEASSEYDVRWAAPSTLPVGTSGDLVLTITPKAPWVLKTETPFAMTLKTSAAVRLDKDRLAAKDFLDPRAPAKSVKTSMVAESAGEHVVAADLKFFLCTPSICKQMTAQSTTKVRVQ